MEEGQLVTYTPSDGVEFCARVIQRAGRRILISYVEEGKPLETVDIVEKETLTTTGE